MSRDDFGRNEPIRSGPVAAAAGNGAGAGGGGADPKGAEAPAGQTARPEPPDDVTLAVAKLMTTAYKVLEDNVAHGRQSTARFQKGEYRIGEVPGDMRYMARNLVEAAEAFAVALFKVCDAFLDDRPKTASGKSGPGAFRDPSPRPVTPSMALTAKFEGKTKAVLRTSTLSRPLSPTTADAINAVLKPCVGDAQPISVKFEVNLAAEGLTALIELPDGQPAGHYSGVVFADKEQKDDLGALTIVISD